MRLCILGAAALVLAATTASAEPARPAPPKAEAVAPGVWLIQGLRLPGREPDGNSVIWQGRHGLVVVMDTGRHAWRQQAVLDLVHARRGRVAAIVNSHWRLDHVSGNPVLKAQWPQAKVYASSAIDQAITGFLARSAVESRSHLDDKSLPPETLEDLKGDLASFEHVEALKPDVVVDAPAARALAGLRLELNLARDAATDGDVWIYDPGARILAAGDLITLPAPFLDTACPQGWRAALAELQAKPFRLVIPGHGRPMSRADLAAWSEAFGAFLDCSASNRPAADCGAGWARATGPLLQANGMDAGRAARLASYYVSEVLRPHGGKSAACRTA